MSDLPEAVWNLLSPILLAAPRAVNRLAGIRLLSPTLVAAPVRGHRRATIGVMAAPVIPAEVLARLSAELGALTLVRANVNAVYSAPGGLVVRVVPEGPLSERLATVHSELHDVDAPVALPVDSASITVAGHHVDVYRRYRPATTDDLDIWAEATAELAAVDVSRMVESRRLRGGIADTVRRYLDELPDELPDEQREELLIRADAALAAVTRMTPRRGLVHGDAHLANLVVDPEGRGLWIDLDTLHVGDPAEDLSWVEVYLRRMVRSSGGMWTRFCALYEGMCGPAGVPLADPQELSVLIGAREVEILLWTATQWNARPELRSLLDDRLATLDHPERGWVII